MVIEKETQKRILETFKGRIDSLGIKHGSKNFRDEQASFIAGVMTVLQMYELELPPSWIMYIMSGRELYEKDKKEY